MDDFLKNYKNHKNPRKTKSGRSVAKTTKMSIIAVHGGALDKIGFHIAERANKSAEIRLDKVLSTYNTWENRTHAR